MEKREYHRPVIVCSRCLGFEHCRFNGQMLANGMVEALKPFVTFITPCPEKDIGLGVPRHPVRVVQQAGENRLVQLVTGDDATGRMNGYCREFFQGIGEVHGFILKSRSPSCGLFDVKYYPPGEKKPPAGKGSGFFGEACLGAFPGAAAEDEARLGNDRIREHFLTRIFTAAEFSTVSTPAELVAFQSRHKLLLMAYSQSEMRKLGRITALQGEAGMEATLAEYREHLLKALEKGPSYRSHVNVLQHAFGYFSKHLSGQEKAFFMDNLEMYRENRTSLTTILNLVLSWVIRFQVDYLGLQSYFSPYPPELRKQFDVYRTKDYWGR